MANWEYLIAVGSNIGDRQQHIARAAALLDAGGIARVTKTSPLIETEAVGGPPGQGAFLNGVWMVSSDFGPHQVLAELQRIEQSCGRVRTVHWGPRTIDLDLLMRNDGIIISTPVLALPHPRIAERPFVKEPLLAIAADWSVVQACSWS